MLLLAERVPPFSTGAADVLSIDLSTFVIYNRVVTMRDLLACGYPYGVQDR